MEKYYVNTQAQPNGDHEVHNARCSYLPSIVNRVYLGEFSSCKSAVAEGKKYYPKADGCFHCSPTCHKQ